MLHDFDYEVHPRAPHHPLKGAEVLISRGVPDAVVRAILAHADYGGVPRVSLLERALYACDELSGFVHAVALVRPGKVITGLEVASVRKKLKDKAFAPSTPTSRSSSARSRALRRRSASRAADRRPAVSSLTGVDGRW